jgi:homoserine kinase
MSQVSIPAGASLVAADGQFTMKDKDGKEIQTFSFSSLLVELGAKTLEAHQAAFQSQMRRSEAMVQCMEELNEIMQEASRLKGKLSGSGDSKSVMTEDDSLDKMIREFNTKYPDFAITAEAPVNLGGKYMYSEQSLSSLVSNLQTAQSLVSSFNEQQGTRTSQAMSRASGFLQQLQTAMQSVRECLTAAAKTGAV